MYRKQCLAMIAPHALASTSGLLSVITFVLLTIQTPLARVLDLMVDVRANGSRSAALWGSKRKGYEFARDHIEVLFAAVSKAHEVGDTRGAVAVLSTIPGLGVVKASFVAQLCGLDVACLDSHNLRRLGMDETALKFPKTLSEAKRNERIDAYIKLTRDTGGSEYWWDTWCEYVASKGGQNRALDTAEKVSEFHVVALGLS